MRVLETTLGGDGVRRQVGQFPTGMAQALNLGPNFSHRWLCYDEADSLRRAGHQHWIKYPYSSAMNPLTHVDIASYLEDPRISGIMYLVRWRLLETSFGTYNFAPVIAALNRCQALGKRMIVRVVCKVYDGNITDPGGAIPVSGNIAIPDYIPADSATYGGTAFRGGIYPVYIGGTGLGWGAQFENAAVMARWKALVTAAGAAFGNHPAFAGWTGPDESARSAWNGSSLPAGMTFATVSSANREIYQHDATTFGASKVWPCINYIDSTAALPAANDATIAEQTWAAQQGYNIAFSDTYPVPENSTVFMQPVYWNDIRSQMTAGRQVMATVDQLSLGADDADLPQRMIRCARQTYRLGADITVWHYFTSNASLRTAWWDAQRAAIDATTAYRP